MSSILVCISPTESHVGPILDVAQAAVDRGHRTRVLTGGRFAERVRAIGAEPLAFSAGGDVLDRIQVTHVKRGRRAMNEGLTETWLAPAAAQREDLRAALAAEPVDAVIADPTVMPVHVLDREELPVIAACGIFPLMVSSRDTAPFGLGMPPTRGVTARLRNRILGVLARRVVLAPMHRDLDRFYRAHGRRLGGLFFSDFVFQKGVLDLFAQFSVPSFEYPRSDLPDIVQFFGPLRPPRTAYELPDWWGLLEGSRPVVHVSQGTAANTDFTELVGPALEALADEPVDVVVTRGRTAGRAVGHLPPLPRNAYAADFLPYDQLMPKVDVFVTNGGYGGLHAALSHGVPIVVAGDTEDKLETSARVAWSGAGLNLRTGRPTAHAVRDAVHAVLRDPSYREASARIGRDIRATTGADGMLAEVERLIAARQAAASVPSDPPVDEAV